MNSWHKKGLLTEYECETQEAVLELSAIAFQINLCDIYDKVNFEKGEEYSCWSWNLSSAAQQK